MTAAVAKQSLLGRSQSLLAGLCRCYAEIFFLSDPRVGMVLLLSTMLNWNVGVAGLLSVASAWAFAWLIHVDRRVLESGCYTYNPLLVGLALGSMLSLSWLTVFLILAAGVLTFLLTIVMVHTLRLYLNLPALSLPFVLASAIAYLATLRYSNLLIQAPQPWEWLAWDFSLPPMAIGFCKSLGAIFFVPSVAVGLTFSVLLAWRSRILFLLAVYGYVVGTLLRAAMYGSLGQACRDLNGFNFILIAMAIGGVYLVPSWKSFLIAAMGVAISMIVLDAVGYQFGVPAYTLPFNLVTLGLLYTLGLHAFPGMAKIVGATPEETLEHDLVSRARFHGQGRTLALPFFGKWTVWQAFDDEWTHQGPWRYAYDFVIVDGDGETNNGGQQLKDYYCYGKPVLAPCRGRIVKVISDLPDNAVGRVDKANNWGNYVVIQDERGFHVELSHFAAGSIRVKAGDWVEPGHTLGLCGNSGYSPQPHLHVHVQVSEQVGSATLPFSFTSYLEGDEYRANDLPRKSRQVEQATVSTKLEALTDFLLNERLRFEVLRRGKPAGELLLTVKMAMDGTFYFESQRGGRLYFGKQAGTFYFYRLEGGDPWLGLLYQALPRLPLVQRDGLHWHDYIPARLLISRWKCWIAHLTAPFFARVARANTEHRFSDRRTIETTICAPFWAMRQTAQVRLGSEHGFELIQVGEIELRACRIVESELSDIQNEASGGSVATKQPSLPVAHPRVTGAI